MSKHSKAQRNRESFRELQQEVFAALASRTQVSMTARSSCEDLLPFAASWLRYIEYALEAVRTLHDAGLGHYAAPIRRAVIEHALLLEAVAREPNAFDSEIRAFRRDALKYKAALSAIGVEAGEAVEAILREEVDDSTTHLDHQRPIKHRCDHLGETGRRYYVAWLQETNLAHANRATAGLFLQYYFDGDDAPTLMLSPQLSAGGWHADAVMADCAILALDAFSRFADGDPFRAEVSRLMRRNYQLQDQATRVGNYDIELDPELRPGERGRTN